MKYKITSDCAEVVLGSDGAMLNSLLFGGREYLWQGDAKYWAGQAPVCFPIVGVLPDNKGTAFSLPCFMKRHGIARISPFSLLESSGSSVVFVQRSDDSTKKMFPFDYELYIGYYLDSSTVTVRYTVVNTGGEKMPFVIGGHPAFNCPLCSGEKFSDYRVVFNRPMKKSVLRPDHATGLVDVEKRYPALDGTDSLLLRHDLFEENDAMIFDNIESKCATLLGPSGHGVKLEFDGMDNLLIWSACGNAPFVALEPWTGISNCSDETDEIEKKRGMTILSPGEKSVHEYKITMI